MSKKVAQVIVETLQSAGEMILTPEQALGRR
jgi:hypothetical protein